MRVFRRVFGPAPALSAALLLLVPASAHADGAADAKDLFARGRDLRTAGDCASAAPLFRKAYELYPAGLGSLRNLAECEEQLGHFASSRRSWLDLSRALVTQDPKDAQKYEGWKADATQAAARLAPKLASVTIDLSATGTDGAAADAKGVDVTLDGESVAPAIVGTPLERDPGRHVVKAAGARVKQPQQQIVDLAPGDTKRVSLRVVVTPDTSGGAAKVTTGPQLPDTPKTTDDTTDHGRASRRTAGWIALGVGAASLIGAGVALAVRQSAQGQIDGSCPSHDNCSPSLRDVQSRGQTASILFDVFGALGVVAAGGGLALVLTSSPQAQQSGFLLTPAPGGASAAWKF